MSKVNEILGFWFESEKEEKNGQNRAIWFDKDLRFDREVKVRFMETYEAARDGKLNYWDKAPKSCLALIILFDQFSRNMFRGSAQAFSADSQALSLAEYALAKNFEQSLLIVQRWFIYLPFMHSEDLKNQQKAVELFRGLGNSPDNFYMLASAIRHLEIIERFGRFPHRNIILGRVSTPEEVEFLKQPNSSF